MVVYGSIKAESPRQRLPPPVDCSCPLLDFFRTLEDDDGVDFHECHCWKWMGGLLFISDQEKQTYYHIEAATSTATSSLDRLDLHCVSHNGNNNNEKPQEWHVQIVGEHPREVAWVVQNVAAAFDQIRIATDDSVWFFTSREYVDRFGAAASSLSPSSSSYNHHNHHPNGSCLLQFQYLTLSAKDFFAILQAGRNLCLQGCNFTEPLHVPAGAVSWPTKQLVITGTHMATLLPLLDFLSSQPSKRGNRRNRTAASTPIGSQPSSTDDDNNEPSSSSSSSMDGNDTEDEDETQSSEASSESGWLLYRLGIFGWGYTPALVQRVVSSRVYGLEFSSLDAASHDICHAALAQGVGRGTLPARQLRLVDHWTSRSSLAVWQALASPACQLTHLSLRLFGDEFPHAANSLWGDLRQRRTRALVEGLRGNTSLESLVLERVPEHFCDWDAVLSTLAEHAPRLQSLTLDASSSSSSRSQFAFSEPALWRLLEAKPQLELHVRDLPPALAQQVNFRRFQRQLRMAGLPRPADLVWAICRHRRAVDKAAWQLSTYLDLVCDSIDRQ